MDDQFAALEALQSLDLKVLHYHNELTEIPKNLEAMRNDVAHVGELLEKEKARLTEAEQWRDGREKEIALHNDFLNKAKSKLMSARNEKENKAAQREIESIRKTIQEHEEETIKIMEAIEQYRSAIEAHTSEFGELETHLKESEDEGKSRMDKAAKAIQEQEARRHELASRVSTKILRLYERIYKKLGRAVVEAKDGTCQGCHMDLSPQMYIELQRGDVLHQCPSCRRLLVYKPPVEEIDPEAVSK